MNLASLTILDTECCFQLPVKVGCVIQSDVKKLNMNFMKKDHVRSNAIAMNPGLRE